LISTFVFVVLLLLVARFALVECGASLAPKVTAPTPESQGGERGTANAEHPSHSAPAPQGSSLVVSENYYPGWVVMVDGKPAAVFRTDYSLIGVVLQAGARRVELTFTSAAYTRGKSLTLLALGLSIVGIAAGAAADRRRRG